MTRSNDQVSSTQHDCGSVPARLACLILQLHAHDFQSAIESPDQIFGFFSGILRTVGNDDDGGRAFAFALQYGAIFDRRGHGFEEAAVVAVAPRRTKRVIAGSRIRNQPRRGWHSLIRDESLCRSPPGPCLHWTMPMRSGKGRTAVTNHCPGRSFHPSPLRELPKRFGISPDSWRPLVHLHGETDDLP